MAGIDGGILKGSGPDLCDLFFLKKINTSPITPDIEVFFEKPALFESYLGEISLSIISKADFTSWLQDFPNICDCIVPLLRADGAENEYQQDYVDAALGNVWRH